MNITDASTLNSEPCAGQSDEHIDRRPRIVGGPGGNDAAEPTLRNVGGGACHSIRFSGQVQPIAGARPAISEPPKNPESCPERSDPQKPNVDDEPENSEPAKNSEFCVLNSELKFPRFPGETPRAFSAFMTFFQLGHARSLPAVAERLGLGVDAVKKWSSRFDWNDRIQSFNAGMLLQQVTIEAEVNKKLAEEWALRTADYREQEWQSAQKLLQIVECCIANFGDAELEKVRLGDIARTLQIASNVSRSALQIAMPIDDRPQRSPTQDLMLEALERMKPQFEAAEKARAAALAKTATPTTAQN